MGWEYRGNNKYYYRKKRVGKKVVSEYIGAGPAAEKIAQEDEVERRKRKRERIAWERRKAEIMELDDALDLLEGITRNLIHANLLLAGFHTHKGQWRRKRNVRRKKEQ